MKKNKRFVLGMAAVALTFIVGFAGCSKSGGGGGRAAPASDFSYDLTADGTGIKITGYTGKGGALVIPSTIEDMPVTEIDGSAFAGSSNNNPNNKDAITSVVIPDSVMVIGWDAFGFIDELTKVTLPDGLKIIPMELFKQCRKLTSVNLPASLEIIGHYAFLECGELNELTIPTSLTSVKFTFWDTDEPANDAFAKCGKLPIKTRQAIQAWGYTGEF